jgi:hypothetical protein
MGVVVGWIWQSEVRLKDDDQILVRRYRHPYWWQMGFPEQRKTSAACQSLSQSHVDFEEVAAWHSIEGRE